MSYRNPEKRKEYMKRYYLKNKERIRLYLKKHRKEHPKIYREGSKRYQDKYPEKFKAQMKRYKYSPKGIFAILKHRAKKNNIEFLMNQNEFINWYIKQPKECGYCGIKNLNHKFNRSKRYIHRFTIDRKDNNKGYSINNIILCCNICNMTKSNIFTFEEFKEIAEKYIKPKLSNNFHLLSTD